MKQIIEHIDQVKPSLEGRSDFIVKDKGDYQVIDYVYSLEDSFDDPMRLECRGLKFDAEGKILARPFHKFFNLGEKPHTTLENLDWSGDLSIQPKLDGSMVHTAVVNGQVVLMTRMGHTDVAQAAEKLLTDHQKKQIKEYDEAGITLIFEWTAPENRIVVKYPKSELTLLDARYKETGTYLSRKTVWELGYVLNIYPVFNEALRGDPVDFVNEARSLKGAEGYVLKFNDIWVKIKADEYVTMHRAKDDTTHEKNIVKLIFENKLDDVLPLLNSEDRKRVLQLQTFYLAHWTSWSGHIQEVVDTGKDLSQKDFATEHIQVLPKDFHPVAFKTRSTGDPADIHLRDLILRNTGSQMQVDRIKNLLRN